MNFQTRIDRESLPSSSSSETKSFESLSFGGELNANLSRQGISRPTELQSEAIPVIASGRDVILVGEPGGGKTLAYGLPVLQKLIESERDGLRALIVVPGIPLAEQVHQSLSSIAGGRLRIDCYTQGHGGVTRARGQLSSGEADIAIVTPHLLHILTGELKILKSSRLETVVFDEFDSMLPSGSAVLLEPLLKGIRKDTQIVLVASTLNEKARNAARWFTSDPIEIILSEPRSGADVTHEAYVIESKQDRYRLLLQLIESGSLRSGLIFTRDNSWATGIQGSLIRRGHMVELLSKDVSRRYHIEAVQRFQDGVVPFLVAAEEMLKGVDFDRLTTVVNFDMPNKYDGYLRRAGRAGRNGIHAKVISILDERGIEKLDRFSVTGGFEHSILPTPELPDVPVPRIFTSRVTGL